MFLRSCRIQNPDIPQAGATGRSRTGRHRVGLRAVRGVPLIMEGAAPPPKGRAPPHFHRSPIVPFAFISPPHTSPSTFPIGRPTNPRALTLARDCVLGGGPCFWFVVQNKSYTIYTQWSNTIVCLWAKTNSNLNRRKGFDRLYVDSHSLTHRCRTAQSGLHRRRWCPIGFTPPPGPKPGHPLGGAGPNWRHSVPLDELDDCILGTSVSPNQRNSFPDMPCMKRVYSDK